MQAHQDLPTNVIFAHISSKARPILGAQTGKRCLDEAEVEMGTRAAPKTLKMSKTMKRLLAKAGGRARPRNQQRAV